MQSLKQNLLKITYANILICQELKNMNKILQNKQSSDMAANDSQSQITSLIKSIKQSKQKIKQYIQVYSNHPNTIFDNILSQQFQNISEFQKFIQNTLKKFVTIVDVQSQGMKDLLIQRSQPILYNRHNIYTYHKSTIKDLILQTQYIWRRFQIQQKILLQEEIKSCPAVQSINQKNKDNERLIIQKTKKSLQQIKQLYGSDLIKCIPQKQVSIKDIIYHTLKRYTKNSSQFNDISTSKDITKLRKIRYLFQIILKNHRLRLVGAPCTGNKLLYRNIILDQQLFNFYRVNQFIYFTNLTSTSPINLIQFGQQATKKPGCLHITFIFKLLPLSEQKKNNFYSGISLKKISNFSEQSEVLIFPFQFFKVTKIQAKKQKHFYIYLLQMADKSLIDKLQMPHPKVKGKNRYYEVDTKELMKQIEKQESSKIVQNKQEKKWKIIRDIYDIFERCNSQPVSQQFKNIKINQSNILLYTITREVYQRVQSQIGINKIINKNNKIQKTVKCHKFKKVFDKCLYKQQQKSFKQKLKVNEYARQFQDLAETINKNMRIYNNQSQINESYNNSENIKRQTMNRRQYQNYHQNSHEKIVSGKSFDTFFLKRKNLKIGKKTIIDQSCSKVSRDLSNQIKKKNE